MDTDKYQIINKKHKAWLIIVSILSLTILSILSINYFFDKYFDNTISKTIESLYYISLIPLTVMLVSVAWIQLDALHEINKDDFLIRIESRFGSEDIIKARAIIHKFHVLAKSKNITKKMRLKKIARMIQNTGQNSKSADEFTYLMNFLDFLDTISYFCNKNSIRIDDADELLGNSIIFYYDVYKPWIYYRRQTYDINFYSHFEKIAIELKRRKGYPIA